jgi:hypothetical protein
MVRLLTVQKGLPCESGEGTANWGTSIATFLLLIFLKTVDGRAGSFGRGLIVFTVSLGKSCELVN